MRLSSDRDLAPSHSITSGHVWLNTFGIYLNE